MSATRFSCGKRTDARRALLISLIAELSVSDFIET
jgi:hypothetical protein